MKVDFLNLNLLHAPLKEEFLSAFSEIIDKGCFISGPKVEEFEEDFARYCGVPHAVGLNSGTTALHMALNALGIGQGDEVIVPAMSFIASAEAVRYSGATPLFADIDPAFLTLDPAKVEAAITPRTKAIMPVHLYGQMADMPAICAIAEKHGLKVIEDAAQAHGAELQGKGPGQWGDVACFSFYPGKNLGALGEGGAVVTRDASLADTVKSLRDWGQSGKYNHVLHGFNARMDGFQGAALRIKLKHLETWTEQRRKLAAVYRQELADTEGIVLPEERPQSRHVYHVFAVQVEDRLGLQERLGERQIGSGIHYPQSIPSLACYRTSGFEAGFPVAEALAKNELSLPMCPTLTEEKIHHVCQTVRQVL